MANPARMHARLQSRGVWKKMLVQKLAVLEDVISRVKRGEGTVDWDTVASNGSAGNCLSNFNKRISSKSSNWKMRSGLLDGQPPLLVDVAADLKRRPFIHSFTLRFISVWWESSRSRPTFVHCSWQAFQLAAQVTTSLSSIACSNEDHGRSQTSACRRRKSRARKMRCVGVRLLLWDRETVRPWDCVTAAWLRDCVTAWPCDRVTVWPCDRVPVRLREHHIVHTRFIVDESVKGMFRLP